MLKPIENLLEDVLVQLHSMGLSWAWSIIALTALVRIIILPLGIKQTRSMLAMQRVQPYLKQIQQKYKNDRQELNAQTMEFYRANRINPMASCLPLLLQLPVFFSLFFVLKDLGKGDSAHDGQYSWLFGFVSDIRLDSIDAGWQGILLIAIYAASQLFSSKVMATSDDPRQKMIMYALPFIFLPFVINFPVGLMLYWITTNLWSVGQHVGIMTFTSNDREIILPPDKKGNQKVIKPKTGRQDSKPESKPKNTTPEARRNNRRKR